MTRGGKKLLHFKLAFSHAKMPGVNGVVVDASPVGLRAILIQHDEQGVLQVIAFASRALTVVEQRYCQTEREALACVWACDREVSFVSSWLSLCILIIKH